MTRRLYTNPRAGVWICRHCGAEMTSKLGHIKACPQLQPSPGVPHEDPPAELMGTGGVLRASVGQILQAKGRA